ncbi:MAG: tetratricopeptide repeat protein [Vicinamibacterales bacterium]
MPFLALALPTTSTAQASLPRLALDSYPASARTALADVYRDAAARPDDVDAVAAFARRLHAWEIWEPAHETYARLRRLAPAAFEWHYLDAVVLQRLARHLEAADVLRQALARSPGYLPAQVRLAEALLEAGKLDESRALFDAVIKEPAAEPAAAVGLGRIAAAQGRHEAAIAYFERAVALFPELAAAHYGLALSYRAVGRSDDARRELALHEQYGARWPKIEDPVLSAVLALKDDARAQLRRGINLAADGDLDAAIATLEAALARDPSLVTAHAALISLYGRARNWTKAEEHYRAVVSQNVELGDAHYDYGVLLGMQEKWDLAANAYRQALAVNPQHAQASNNLGQILERDRSFEAAAVEYRQALTSQPGFRLARFNLGRMLLVLGRPEEAVVEFDKLTEPRDAESPRYLFALATAHVRAGRKNEGIKWATEAKRLAVEFGQHDLARAIERDLALLK